METEEAEGDQWRLKRPRETNGDLRGRGRLMETEEAEGDQWRLKRPRETNGD